MAYFNGKHQILNVTTHNTTSMGTLEITENGEYDVARYASVVINVPRGTVSATDDGKGNVTIIIA